MTRLARNHQILGAVAMVKKAWAMPLRGRSAPLRAEPVPVSGLRRAATIAEALAALCFIAFAVGLAVLA